MGVRPAGYWNLTKAPLKELAIIHSLPNNHVYPSFSLGRISVTLMGIELGIALLTRFIGSKALRVWLLYRHNKSERLRSPRKGNRRSQWSFRGNMSTWNLLAIITYRMVESLTIEEQYAFIWPRSNMSRLIFPNLRALSPYSLPFPMWLAQSSTGKWPSIEEASRLQSARSQAW